MIRCQNALTEFLSAFILTMCQSLIKICLLLQCFNHYSNRIFRKISSFGIYSWLLDLILLPLYDLLLLHNKQFQLKTFLHLNSYEKAKKSFYILKTSCCIAVKVSTERSKCSNAIVSLVNLHVDRFKGKVVCVYLCLCVVSQNVNCLFFFESQQQQTQQQQQTEKEGPSDTIQNIKSNQNQPKPITSI